MKIVFPGLLVFFLFFQSFTCLAQHDSREDSILADQLSRWGEVYLALPRTENLDLHQLTKILSLAKRSGDTLFAFASNEEMRRFAGMNIPYTVIPHPQVLNPVMFTGTEDNSPLTWNYYPTYDAYEDLMFAFQDNFPQLCHIDTLAVLPSGRKLLAAKISDNVSNIENEPEFLYVSSIHGNELTGYVLMLQLIDFLLTNYSFQDQVTSLVNNVEIYICPLANPDGTFHGGNQTVSGAIRYNANAVDLNRNYPDPQDGPHPDGNAWQPETLAFMEYAGEHDFTMAANFHGGAEVFNYPWDTWVQLPADNAWWLHAGRGYADTIHHYAPASYFNDEDNGVTNGYAWYEINGGQQDYMNYFRQCREATIEISNSYIPAASTLPAYWNYNYRSFLNYINESLWGIRGLITDSLSGTPLKAKVHIAGHDIDSSHVYSSLPNGNYHRFLAPGNYNLTFSAPGYHSKTISGVGAAYFSSTTLDVSLKPMLPDVNGLAIYDTLSNLPLAGLTLYLINAAGDTLRSSTTDTSGFFTFPDVYPGTYGLSVSCPLPSGGYNSVDALLILKHFVHLELLEGLRAQAADVNNLNNINAVDAMFVQQRFLGMLSGFLGSEWVFNLPPIFIENIDVLITVNGLCKGDVNASYTP